MPGHGRSRKALPRANRSTAAREGRSVRPRERRQRRRSVRRTRRRSRRRVGRHLSGLAARDRALRLGWHGRVARLSPQRPRGSAAARVYREGQSQRHHTHRARSACGQPAGNPAIREARLRARGRQAQWHEVRRRVFRLGPHESSPLSRAAAAVATSAFIPPRLAVGEHVLRPFRSDDAAAWCAYLTDPRVTEHTSWPSITPELITGVVAKTIADYGRRESLRWALVRGDDDKLIGSCGYNRWAAEQGTAELAYDLAPAYWGLGLMSGAVRAAVAWALGAGSLNRVEAFVMTTNEPSIKV